MRCNPIGVCAVLLFTGCGKTPPDEMFARAEELRKLQSHQAAIEQYREIISEYPASAEAESSQFLIATIYNEGTKEFDKAVVEYGRYVEKYPDLQQTPWALFMVGYLYHNELHNLDSAAAAYNRFLERFPRHEMALSAKFELENLGKSPEELLSNVVREPEPAVAAQGGKSPGKKQ